MTPTLTAEFSSPAAAAKPPAQLERGQWCWPETFPASRNLFVFFRRAFHLGFAPERMPFRVFADTRYRLWVNGVIVGHGPGRFVPEHPEADWRDLARWLFAGENVIGVEVHHIGDVSFEAMASEPVFWAEGGRPGEVDLATPGDWLAWRCTARDPGAPGYSFAQGPVEILDLRQLPVGWASPGFDDSGWVRPRLVFAPARAEPAPRSVPLASGEWLRPRRLTALGPLDNQEFVYGLRLDAGPDAACDNGVRLVYATWIFSPRAQRVTLGLFWGPHFLDGAPLRAERCADYGNRENFTVELSPGWHLLYGEPEAKTRHWGLLVGVPVDAGLMLAAEPDPECPDSFLYAGPRPELSAAVSAGRAPASREELEATGIAWRRWRRDQRPRLPARYVGWDRLAPGTPSPSEDEDVDDICFGAGSSAVCFDFGGEFLGRVRLEVDAPAGTIFDVANDECVRPTDGLINLFRHHWGINSADRFVWSGGAGFIEGFHPRGGRYLQVSVRGAGRPVTLRSVAVRAHSAPLPAGASFICSEPLFNWIWSAGVETLRACLADTFLDCPWREQGCYTGDVLVEQRVLRMVSTDLSHARRSLQLFAQALRPDGQLPDVVPATKADTLFDYSLLWIVALEEYQAETADLAFAGEVWPVLEAVLASPHWREGDSGLWLADAPVCVFGDSGLGPQDRRGENGLLNAYRVRAHRAAARLAARLGKNERATFFSAEAARAEEAFQRLWDPRSRRFRRRADARDPEPLAPAAHANVLALCWDLARPDQVEGAFAHIEECLPATLALKPGRLELFYHHFLLEACRRHGREVLAESVLKKHYGHLRDQGAWTLWEYFSPNRSHCHAWAASPLPYFIRHVLGVRPESDDTPGRLVIDPHPGSLEWAEGVYPHTAGPVRVRWGRGADGALRVTHTAPPGVSVSLAGLAARA